MNFTTLPPAEALLFEGGEEAGVPCFGARSQESGPLYMQELWLFL